MRPVEDTSDEWLNVAVAEHVMGWTLMDIDADMPVRKIKKFLGYPRMAEYAMRDNSDGCALLSLMHEGTGYLHGWWYWDGWLTPAGESDNYYGARNWCPSTDDYHSDDVVEKLDATHSFEEKETQRGWQVRFRIRCPWKSHGVRQTYCLPGGKTGQVFDGYANARGRHSDRAICIAALKAYGVVGIRTVGRWEGRIIWRDAIGWPFV